VDRLWIKFGEEEGHFIDPSISRLGRLLFLLGSVSMVDRHLLSGLDSLNYDAYCSGRQQLDDLSCVKGK